MHTDEGSSAGLLRTFMYIGALLASAANAAVYKHGATTSGLHHLSWLLLAVAVLFLAATVADRSLSRIGDSADSDVQRSGTPDDRSRSGNPQ